VAAVRPSSPSSDFFLEISDLSLVPWHLLKSSLAGTVTFRLHLCSLVNSTTIYTTTEKRRADVLLRASSSLQVAAERNRSGIHSAQKAI